MSSNSSGNIEESPKVTKEPATKLLSIKSFAQRDVITESGENKEDQDALMKDEISSCDSGDSISSLKLELDHQNTVIKFPDPVSFDFGFVSPLPKLNTVANFTYKTVISYNKHEDESPAFEETNCETGSLSNVVEQPKTQTPSVLNVNGDNNLNEQIIQNPDKNNPENDNDEVSEPEKTLMIETTATSPKQEFFNVKANFEDKRIISYIPRPTNDLLTERTQANHYFSRNSSMLSEKRSPEMIGRKDQNLKILSNMKRLKKEEMKSCNSNLGCHRVYINVPIEVVILELLSNLISVHPLVRSRADNKTSVLRSHSNKQRSMYRQEMESKVLHYNRLHPRDWQ